MTISSIYKITSIRKPCTAKLFKHLSVGSIIRVSTTVARKYRELPTLIVVNIETGEQTNMTTSELADIYTYFEFERLKDGI